MIDINAIAPRIMITFGDGKFFLTQSTVVAMVICLILGIVGVWLGSGLEKIPRGKQVVAEVIVCWIYGYAKSGLGPKYKTYAPYIGTVFSFIVIASATGIFGLNPITADLTITAALGAMTFILIQYSAFREVGIKGKLREMCDPYPFMFPIKLMDEITLPVTLSLRLFGNMFGGVLVSEMWLKFMEFLSNLIVENVPFLRAVTILPLNGYFDMFEPVVQTYIFTMLTMVNLKAAITMLGEGEAPRLKANPERDSQTRQKLAG